MTLFANWLADIVAISLDWLHRRPRANGAIGTVAGLWTWIISRVQDISPLIQFIGMTAGALTACVSLAIAIRSWRAGRNAKSSPKS